jgi:RNA polymerase sigma factor (sigma-70 family)
LMDAGRIFQDNVTSMSTLSDPKDFLELFRRLAALDGSAFDEIVGSLRDRLLRPARRRLERKPDVRAVYDEEDAFQSAMSIIWFRILAGDMNPPGGVDEFVRLARTIIRRRITAKARAEGAQKRNPTPNEPAAVSVESLDECVPDGLSVFRSSLPAPEAQAIAEDETRWLLNILGWELREVAEDRFYDGLTIDQIAQRRGISPSTVARRLDEIMVIWRAAVRKYRE